MKPEKNVLSAIGQLLSDMDETVSVAESVTSGLLQYSLSQITNASEFYKGGITAYTLEEKVRFLEVDEQEAESCDCVAPNIAETMAVNVAKSFNTEWGMAVTGYATPVEESDFKIFAYFSFSHKGKVVLTQKINLNPQAEPENVQNYYAEFILSRFRNQLEQEKAS